MDGNERDSEMTAALTRSRQEIRMANLRQKLVSAGVVRLYETSRNEISPTTGSGDIRFTIGGKELLAWVREEPDAAGAIKLFGYPVVSSTDATIVPEGDILPLLRQSAEETVQYVAKVVEILQVQSTHSRTTPHYWVVVDCGLLLTLSLNAPSIETLAAGDVVRGSGVLEFRVLKSPSR